MRDGSRVGAGGWPGAAALVAALALAALAARPWGGDDAGQPRRGTVGELVTVHEAPAPARRASPAPPARPTTPPPHGASAGAGARGEWRPGEVDVRGELPEIRLPSELEPARPDVVVALTPTGPGPAVVPHAHVAERADARTPHALGMTGGAPAMTDGATPDADATEGPEPGALYWFGPEGLVKVQVLMEAQR